MGPQPLPWGSSSTMKILFLHSLQSPKWAASQVVLSCSTLGLRTAQWSVTTAANMDEMPTRITRKVIFTLVFLSSSMVTVEDKWALSLYRSLKVLLSLNWFFSLVYFSGAKKNVKVTRQHAISSLKRRCLQISASAWKKRPDNSALVFSLSLSLPVGQSFSMVGCVFRPAFMMQTEKKFIN